MGKATSKTLVSTLVSTKLFKLFRRFGSVMEYPKILNFQKLILSSIKLTINCLHISWSHLEFKLQIHNKLYYYLWFIYVKNSYHRQIDSFEIDKILWTFHFLHTFRIGDIQDRNCNADRPICYVANSENNWKYFSWELVQPKTFVPFKNSIPILNFGIIT